jgi:4-diphosphocytidyl-2-C-methyl-D-erythritol kinase
MQQPQFTWTHDALLMRAPAKVNLSLLIAGKRPDGYHEIDTIMAKVDWYDELLFERSREPGLRLVCKGPNWAPEGSANHVFTACQMLAAHAGYTGGITVTLNKLIPAGTGLGSASSDAAAALIGLNEFAHLAVVPDTLAGMAARIGSDVPFFLGGPLARCTGRGEKITPIGEIYTFSAILVLPTVAVSTKTVYQSYKHNSALYAQEVERINRFAAAGTIDSVAGLGVNMLQETCFSLHAELRSLKDALTNLGIGRVCLSGSGSSMYVLTGEVDEAKRNHYQQLIMQRTSCASVVVHNNRW